MVRKVIMETVNYTDFRSKLATILDKVSQNHNPILITRRNSEPTVVMSLKDFQSYDETAYLMASPKNAKRLNDAILEMEQGQLEEHELIES